MKQKLELWIKRLTSWSWYLRVFDRLFARSAVRQAASLSVVVIVFILLLSGVGWWLWQEKSYGRHLQDVVYLFIYPDSFGEVKDTGGGQKWFYSFALLAGTIIVGGLLISVLTNMLQNRVQRVRNGYVTYNYLSGHILVIGYDEIVPNLVSQICRQYPERHVVVQSILPAQQVRNAVFAATPDKYEKHIFIYNGRRDSIDDLSRLGVGEAHEIFLIGDRSSDDHDALNMECMSILSKLLEDHKKKTGSTHKIPFNVLFEDRATTIAFQTTDIASLLKEHVDLYPLNFYENWCRQALAGEVFGSGRPLAQLDRGDNNAFAGITADSKRHAQLVVVGMSRLGISLGIQAAHMMHYPNFRHGNGLESVITFIDLDADVEMRRFMCMHSPFFEVQTATYTDMSDSGSGTPVTIAPKRYSGEDADFVGVRFEFVKGDIFSPGVREMLEARARDDSLSLTVAITLNHSRLNASVGLSLPKSLFDVNRNIPILVQQRTSGALLSTLAADQDNRFCNVIPFGMIECSYDLDHQIEKMAMQLNYAYLQARLNQMALSDDVEGYWNALPVSKQWSSIHAVSFIFTKLRSLGIAPARAGRILESSDKSLIASACEIEHRRWCAERLLLGFSRCAENDTRIPQTHKCIAPNHVVKQFKQAVDENGIGQFELNDRSTLKAIPKIMEIIGKNAEKRRQAEVQESAQKNRWRQLAVSKFNPFRRSVTDKNVYGS